MSVTTPGYDEWIAGDGTDDGVKHLMSTRLITIELGAPLPKAVEGAETYDHVWAIVMRYGIPVGCAIIDNARTPVLEDQLRGEIVRQLSDRLLDEADYQDVNAFAEAIGHAPADRHVPPEFQAEPELADLLPALKPKTGRNFFLSIVVCTRDRPDDLQRCLSSLTSLHPGRHRLEIVVVDNNPSSGLTEPIVNRFVGVRYDKESRQGLSYAKNRGLIVARGDIVAYIDDDVVVPPEWPTRILAPFTDERVMCVCGLVLPLELETFSQEMFERYNGLGRGYRARIFDADYFNHPKHRAVPTWELGATANAAFRKSIITQTGMFDETLGAGLPTGCNEDTYMFYRILKYGHLCYYEPAAFVWHKHRKTLPALEQQLYNYGKGQTSYQLRTLVSDGDKRAIWQLLRVLPQWHANRLYRILRGRLHFPIRLVWKELEGNVVGPYAFYKAVIMHRRLKKRT